MNHDYVSLEAPHERDFALTDPKGFLKRYSQRENFLVIPWFQVTSS